MWRWLADECVHASVVAELRRSGHDVVYAAEDLQRMDDIGLAAEAQSSGRLLLTEDKDFGDVVFRQGYKVPGVVLLRISPARREMKWPRLESAIKHFSEALHGHYLVVDERKFRYRPLPKSEG